MTHIKILLSQYDTVGFQIAEEVGTKTIPNGDARKARDKILQNFQPSIRDSKKGFWIKFTKSEIKYLQGTPKVVS